MIVTENHLVTFESLSRNARHQTVVCTDPCHNHKSPRLEMFGVFYRGHFIAITQDVDQYDVQIDHDPRRQEYKLTWEEVLTYVEGATKS